MLEVIRTLDSKSTAIYSSISFFCSDNKGSSNQDHDVSSSIPAEGCNRNESLRELKQELLAADSKTVITKLVSWLVQKEKNKGK